MKLDGRQTAEALYSHNHILLITHKNPDGDTLGSAAALCHALRRAGKQAFLFPNPQITEKYLPFVEKYFADDGFEPEYVVAVDVAAKDMVNRGFSGKINLCIDHHPSEHDFADDELVIPELSACGEIVLQVIDELCGKVSKAEANLLYIALSTDTGCFQYANTNANSFRNAARLLDAGCENWPLNSRFFRKQSRARLQLEGMIYAGMKFYHDGIVCVATVTQEMIEKSGATEDDFEDLAALPGRIEDEKLGITIRELDDGDCKVSVRSTEDISSSDICAYFGGGGHRMAAGCTISATPEKAAELLMNVVDEVLR